jgi:ribosomal protein L37AE/L43A
VEPSKEILALAHSKPAVVRVKIFALKKSELMELSKAYDLDPSGTKEELQERLLGYLHRLESEEEPEPEAETHPEPAATVGPTPELAKEPPPQKSVEPIATAPTSAAQGATAEEAAQPTESTPVAQAAVVPAPVVAVPAAEAAPAPRPAQHAEHPCPTCGRELTYIAQYNRWYCYYCQRYAPAVSRSKNACPTCGATMRWIDQHHRWWCDSCAKYASADLPAPATPAAEAAVPSAATAAAPARSVVGHRHGSPAGGAALAGLGLALYIVYAFFAYLAEMLGFVPPTGVTPEILNYLQFFGFLFLALGIIVGLYALRDRA